MQMFMFNFGTWQVGSNQELCNFFSMSQFIRLIVTVHSDFLSIQAAVQLLIGLCIIILETCVLGVCAEVFVLLTFFIAYLYVLKFIGGGASTPATPLA